MQRLEQSIAEQKKLDGDLQIYSGIQSLTKELADELIERIDVYGGDRVEVTWKFENSTVKQLVSAIYVYESDRAVIVFKFKDEMEGDSWVDKW